METPLRVDLGGRSYPIHIGQGALAQLPQVLRELKASGTVAIVTDENVGALYGERLAELAAEAGVNTATCTMPAGETHKRLARIEEFCGHFLEANLDRRSVVLTLGGGVVGDVGGFAAACFMRGVRFAQVPTTIVAQVDSSVGGKTGVNHPSGKNIIGAFHQPSAVVIDLTVLETLPERELRAGLAEAIKHGLIADAELFDYMEQNAEAILGLDLDALEHPIRRSCEIKAAVVAEDERENGLRAILNYGHTFGHAFEAVTAYGEFIHGEAVALGMHAAGLLAQALGLVDEDFVTRQRRCLRAYGLPVRWPGLPVEETLHAMKHDKKVVSGTMKFILADGMGHVVQRTDVPEDLVLSVLEELRAQ